MPDGSPSGLMTSAPHTEILERTQCSMISGVFPTGAQVQRRVGMSWKPVSSPNAMQAPRSLAFFGCWATFLCASGQYPDHLALRPDVQAFEGSSRVGAARDPYSPRGNSHQRTAES